MSGEGERTTNLTAEWSSHHWGSGEALACSSKKCKLACSCVRVANSQHRNEKKIDTYSQPHNSRSSSSMPRYMLSVKFTSNQHIFNLYEYTYE